MLEISKISRRLLLAVGALGIGLMMFGGTIIKMFNDTDVMRNGVQTLGQVTDTSRYLETSNDKQFQRYRLHYTFQDANGSPFSSEDTVSKDAYEGYVIGQSIEVYYYPNMPSSSFVDLDGKIAQNRLQIIVGAILTLLGLSSLLAWGYSGNKDNI